MAMSDVVVVEWAPSDTPFETVPTWVDITDHMQRVFISRGRSGSLEDYKAGEATFTVLNGVPGTAPWLDQDTFYRWRQIRVRLDDGGSNTAPLFYGWIQDVQHNVHGAPLPSSATITATDRVGAMTRVSSITFEAPPGAEGYTTDTASWIGLMDNMTSLNAFGRDDDADTFSTAPIFFETQEQAALDDATPINIVAGKPLELIMRALEVESGAISTGADGVLVVNGRYSAIKALSSSAAFTLSDTPGVGEYGAVLPDVEIAQPGTDYFNSVEATGYRTYPVTVYTGGISDFSDTLSRAGLATDRRAWVEANADLWANLYGQTDSWPAAVSLMLHPASSAALAKDVADATNYLGRSWVQVELTPTGTTQKTWKLIADGIDHDIAPDRWVATLRGSSGDRWAVFPTWAQIGKVGTSLVGSSTKVGP